MDCPFAIAQLIETDGAGGAERVVVELATRLRASGVASVVFVPAGGDGWLARQLQGSGVVVEHFRLGSPFSPACAREMAAAFRVHRVAIAHSHEFSMAVYGAWASWLAGVPHVITMHGRRYYAARLRRRVAMRAAIAASRRTVAVSNQLAGHLSRDLHVARSSIAVVANGVSQRSLGQTTLRAELNLGASEPLVVSVGNLYPVKGHRYLIDAMGLLATRHPQVHVAIGGRGDEADALRAQARENGIGARIHLLGLRSDVPELLAAADLFVLPSLSEGLPLALLEAMFAACPIVATDVGEIRAVLRNGNAGLIVRPGDAAALAAGIDVLLSSPEQARALGRRARARAIAEYDATGMVARYSSMYEEALRTSRPRFARLPTHYAANS